MADLVSLDDVKRAQPPIEHDDDDDLLRALIGAASEMVIGYLGPRAQAVIGIDDAGDFPPDAILPAAVRVATVIVARHLYQPIEKLPDVPGALPRMAVSLLYRLCDPPFA